MFAFESATGMSRPASLTPWSTVPVGVPIVQAINACGFAALIFVICAATEMIGVVHVLMRDELDVFVLRQSENFSEVLVRILSRRIGRK